MYDSMELNGAAPGKTYRFPDSFAIFCIVFFLLALLLAIWVGLRGPTVGADTENYLDFYREVSSCKCFPGQFEIGFEAIVYFFGLFDADPRVLLFSLSIMSFSLVFLVAKNASRYYLDERDARKLLMVILAAFLLSPFFLSSQINVIRQGVSALFLFLAIFDARSGHVFKTLLWALLSLSFHHTAALFFISLAILVLGRRAILFFTIAMFILYIFGGSEDIVIFLTDISGHDLYGRISEYAVGAEYKAGVRLDFAAFSISIPILAVLFSRFFHMSFEYTRWAANIYLCLLMPFWLFGWANYSDRFAFTAWLFASIVFSIGLAPTLKKFSVGVVSVPVFISFFVFWFYLVSA